MDIDGSNNTGQGPQQQQQNSNDIEIEQSFLQQFSCLGTTDHDELGTIFTSSSNKFIN